jgi:hypothetical protein
MATADLIFHRFLRLLRNVAALVAIFGASSAGFAADSNLLPGKPDIWGVWVGTGGYPDIDPRYRNTPWPKVEFTPWGAAESKRISTPETPDECMPYGPVAYVAGGSLFPMELARTTKGLLLTYEPSPIPRRIYTDGRKHPEELDPTWLGHSVAHWEKDTLVIDTVGLNGRSRPLNGYLSGAINSPTENAPRLPVSDQLHMVERIRLMSGGEYLENEITIEDLKTYTRPFTVRHYWQRRSDLDTLEYFCADNRRPEAEGHSRNEP